MSRSQDNPCASAHSAVIPTQKHQSAPRREFIRDALRYPALFGLGGLAASVVVRGGPWRILQCRRACIRKNVFGIFGNLDLHQGGGRGKCVFVGFNEGCTVPPRHVCLGERKSCFCAYDDGDPGGVSGRDAGSRCLPALLGDLPYRWRPPAAHRMMRIHHLFVSPGHNYFGHHGGPPGNYSVIEADEIDCVAGRGIRGDRFFDYKEDYKGQITFFSLEVFDALRRELNLPDVQPAVTRRNVFVSGANLSDLVGREFEVQDVRFAGVEECRPCYWMNHALGDERAEGWLKGRGGLRARVLTDGILRSDR